MVCGCTATMQVFHQWIPSLLEREICSGSNITRLTTWDYCTAVVDGIDKKERFTGYRPSNGKSVEVRFVPRRASYIWSRLDPAGSVLPKVTTLQV